MSTFDLLISGGTIVTMDPERRILIGSAIGISGGTIVTMDPERRILIGSAIGISCDRIVERFPDSGQAPEARETIEYTGKVVMPALIDTPGPPGIR